MSGTYTSWALTLLLCPGLVAASGIDHRVNKDTGGIWRVHKPVPYVLGGLTVAGALWEGDESRLGRTLWKTVDASLITALGTEGIKRLTERPRPSQINDPDLWRQGSKYPSFPSGHVSFTAAAVTPLILEYREDHPWVYALSALPAYEMVARVKAQAHWQSDVLAGAALGVAVGYLSHGWSDSLIANVLPDGITVGIHTRF